MLATAITQSCLINSFGVIRLLQSCLSFYVSYVVLVTAVVTTIYWSSMYSRTTLTLLARFCYTDPCCTLILFYNLCGLAGFPFTSFVWLKTFVLELFTCFGSLLLFTTAFAFCMSVAYYLRGVRYLTVVDSLSLP